MNSRNDHDEDDRPRLYIGPETRGGRDDLLDEARRRVRDEDERNRESLRLARRLLVAFVLIMLLGVVFYLVLPHYKLRLPPVVPILCFLAIAVGSIMTLRE